MTLAEGTWTAEPGRGEVGFAVKDLWGLRTVRGRFGAYDARLEVRAGGAAGELTIEAGTLDTGDRRRDRHLRSPAFFDVERHPRIVFTTTAVTNHMVTGELAIGSARVRLEIPVRVEHRDGALRLEGTTTVPRAAAGLDWNRLGMIRGDAVLHARLTLRRTAPR
jgi:polyisoprenoid-binding protein YceI